MKAAGWEAGGRGNVMSQAGISARLPKTEMGPGKPFIQRLAHGHVQATSIVFNRLTYTTTYNRWGIFNLEPINGFSRVGGGVLGTEWCKCQISIFF